MVLCDTFTGGGYTDWFLPSKDELNLIYQNIGPGGLNIGIFNNGYWSSTENGSVDSWCQFFSNGSTSTNSKSNSHSIRAVRNFILEAPTFIGATNCIWVSNSGWNYVI